MFESDMQAILGQPDFALPYWDWARDAALSDPTTAPIWDVAFMGGQGNPVSTGPFRTGQWTLAGGGSLVRQFGVSAAALPSQADVLSALALPTYDTAPWNSTSANSFRNHLEGWDTNPAGLHNRVHLWVGGSMLPMTSPNDPVFFLHHANTDRIWSIWQALYGQNSFLPTQGAREGHNLNDEMYPWNVGVNQVTNAGLINAVTLRPQPPAYTYWSLWSVGTQYNLGQFQPSQSADGGNFQNVACNWTLISLAFDNVGTAWVVGTSNNLGIRGDNGTCAAQTSNWTLISIAFDLNNTLWGVGTQNNLGYWANGVWSADSNSDWTLLSIAGDANGNLWGVGTQNNVGIRNASTGKWAAVTGMGTGIVSLAFDAQGRCYSVDLAGNLRIWLSDTQQWSNLGFYGGWTLRCVAFKK
jgi:hypothetical protein